MKLVVFGSGRGSNYRAIIENTSPEIIKIAAVIVNRVDAPMIELARTFGHPLIIIDSRGMSREDHEKQILTELRQYEYDLAVLAGYMRVLSPNFLKQIGVPVVNIHPSLLPAFPGLNAQRQAIEAGVKESGCTVHLVNEIVDGGEILGQERVLIYPSDNEITLTKRILEKEHQLYPRIITEIAEGKIQIRV